jgi:hypothetical protein
MYDERPVVTIESIYDGEHARRVITASIEDYDEEFGRP